MWSPHDQGRGGGESADFAGRQVGEGLERWKGAGTVDCGECLLMKGARPYGERAPFNKRGLLGGRFGDFLLFFMQLRVDVN